MIVPGYPNAVFKVWSLEVNLAFTQSISLQSLVKVSKWKSYNIKFQQQTTTLHPYVKLYTFMEWPRYVAFKIFRQAPLYLLSGYMKPNPPSQVASSNPVLERDYLQRNGDVEAWEQG